jgi:hypothetical protein
MDKEQFLKLSDLDKVKYAIEESLKEHKKYNTEYWKGSAFMGNSILETIEQVKNLTMPVVVGQSEQLVCEYCNGFGRRGCKILGHIKCPVCGKR